MKISNEKINKVLLTIYFFVAIFLPDFCSIRTRNIVLLFNILFCMYYALQHKRIPVNRRLFKCFLGFIPFVIYVVINIYIHMMFDSNHKEAYKSNMTGNVVTFFYLIILMLTINLMCIHFNIGYNAYVRIIIGVAIIQFVCVVLAALSPTMKSFFNSFTLRYSYDETIKSSINRFASNRAYGFANNLFDSFGYITSFMTCLALIKGVANKEKKWIVFAVVSLYMPAMNTRTGILLSAVGMGIVLLYFFRPKNLYKYLFVLMVGVLGIVIVFQRLPQYTQKSILLGFREMVLFIQGDTSVSVLNQLLVEDIVIPQDIFFGQAAAPEFYSYSGIDSGYIQALWRYGLFGIFLYIIGFGYMCYCTFKYYSDTKEKKCMIIIIVAFVMLYSFKLFALFNLGSLVIIFGLIIAICVEYLYSIETRGFDI